MAESNGVKAGIKTTELIALIAGLLTAILPVVLEKLPAESAWIPILGAVLAAAAYIGGRSWVKVGASKAEAMKAIANGKKDPS